MRGFFRPVKRCKSDHWNEGNCPFFSREFDEDTDKTYLICTAVGIPYKRLSDISLPLGALEWKGNFPDWCPLEKRDDKK